METGIIIVWTATLIIALILTVVILKLVFLILRTERDILQLAKITLTASHGIERNTALIAKLEITKGVAGKILGAATAIEAGSRSVADKLQSVGRALAEKRG